MNCLFCNNEIDFYLCRKCECFYNNYYNQTSFYHNKYYVIYNNQNLTLMVLGYKTIIREVLINITLKHHCSLQSIKNKVDALLIFS